MWIENLWFLWILFDTTNIALSNTHTSSSSISFKTHFDTNNKLFWWLFIRESGVKSKSHTHKMSEIMNNLSLDWRFPITRFIHIFMKLHIGKSQNKKERKIMRKQRGKSVIGADIINIHFFSVKCLLIQLIFLILLLDTLLITYHHMKIIFLRFSLWWWLFPLFYVRVWWNECVWVFDNKKFIVIVRIFPRSCEGFQLGTTYYERAREEK